jgi:hypothetical protein
MQGYSPACWKSSRNDPAARPRRPPRSNRRKRSRLPLGKAPGNGGARRFPRRAQVTARIRQGLDYARRSARFSPSRLFAQEDLAACQRQRCRAKLRVRRRVFAAIHAKSSRAYRARAVPAKQGRDRRRGRMRKNRRPFAPRRRGLAPSTAFQGRLRMREHRLRHGERGGAGTSRQITLEGNHGRFSAASVKTAPRAIAALPRGQRCLLARSTTNIGFHSLTFAKRRCLAHATTWRKEKAHGRGPSTAASRINRVKRSFVTRPSQAHGRGAPQ